MINLFYWMAKNKLTNEELAKKSGLNINTVKNLKKGKGKPNPKTLGKLAEAFEVDVAELLKHEM